MIFRNLNSAVKFCEELFGNNEAIKIEAYKPVRSISQNRLYWLWLNCVSQETGYERDELHQIFKLKYLEKRKVKIKNSAYFLPASTTTLDTKEFKNYLDKIQIFCSVELSITLPNPEDKNFNEFCEYYA